MSVSNGGVIGPDNIPDLTPAQSEQDEVTATFTSPGTHTTAARTTSVDVFIVSGGGGGGAMNNSFNGGGGGGGGG